MQEQVVKGTKKLTLEEQVQLERKQHELNLIKQQTPFRRRLWKISRIMASVGAIMFGAMMLITTTDVIGRYFFMRPLNGAQELVGLMLVIGGTWGMGYCQLHMMHIRINVLSEKFSRRGQAILWVIAYIVSATVAGLVAWRAFISTHENIVELLGTRSDVLGVLYWPFWLLMGIGFTWACFIFLVELSKSFSEVFKR